MKYVILIADDEAEIRDLLRLYLENSGYDVLEAADGLEALAVLKKEHVDLAVLDVMMPRMNGLHVLKKIRETSNIPVLVFLQKMQIRIRFLGSIWARTII
ncbi:MAG: response regulator [Dorea sp.]